MTAEVNLFSLVWAHRVAFTSVVIGMVIATLVFLGLSTPLYRVTAVVAPIESVPSARSISRVSSLMGLAGLGLPEDVQTFAIFRYLLHSPELARTIPDSDRVLKSVYYRQWDSERQAWKAPGVVARSIRLLRQMFGDVPDWRPPDYRDLSEHMRERLSISDVGTTGLVRLTFDHENADVAAEILADYIAGADQLLRVQERQRKTAEREYLLKKLSDTTIAEVRLALADLVAAREQELVLLNTNQSVAYKLVQPVVLTPQAVYPPKLLFAMLGAAFGVVLGIAYVLLQAKRARR